MQNRNDDPGTPNSECRPFVAKGTHAIELRNVFPRWNWHWFSHLVFFLTGIAAIIMAVPARNDDYRGSAWWQRQCNKVMLEGNQAVRKKWVAVESVQHGWPGSWLVRAVDRGKPKFSSRKRAFNSWRNLESWPVDAIAWRIHPGFLLLDILLAYLAAFGIAFGIEYWLRQNDGKLRFGLKTGLVVIAVFAAILGWVDRHRAMYEAEREVENYFAGEKRFRAYHQYAGPDWLPQILGGRESLAWMEHIVGVNLWNIKSTDSVWQNDIEQIARLSELQRVSTYIPFPVSLVEKLAEARNLSELNLHVLNEKQMLAHAALRTDKLQFMSIDEFELLNRLKLKKMTISGKVTTAQIDELLSALLLKQLHLNYVSVAPDDLKYLREKYALTEIIVP